MRKCSHEWDLYFTGSGTCELPFFWSDLNGVFSFLLYRETETRQGCSEASQDSPRPLLLFSFLQTGYSVLHD